MRKLSLIAAVALGGLVAFSMMATAQEASKDAKKGKRGASVEQRLEQMKKNLELKDEQVPKVKTALEDMQKKMQALREDTNLDQQKRREKMRSLMEDQNKKMKGILTEEQYKKYQEMGPRGGKKGFGGEQKKGKKKTE